jgi:hypothetical protein
MSLLCPRRKFYDRLKELREYHKRFPVHDISNPEDDSEMLQEEPKVVFTGEEANGRWAGTGFDALWRFVEICGGTTTGFTTTRRLCGAFKMHQEQIISSVCLVSCTMCFSFR